MTAERVEQAVSRLERLIKDEHPEVRRVFVEAQSFDAHRRAAAEEEERQRVFSEEPLEDAAA